MSWPSSLGVAVLGAIVGLFATGFLASLTATWYRIPNFEAQSAAYTASLAILGMVGGFVIGLVASRLIAAGANPGFLKALATSQGVLLGLLLIIGITARLLADIPPTIDGEQLMLAVEIRWPASHKESPASLPGEPTLTLGSITRMSHTQRVSSLGPLWTSDARRVDGRWVAPGAVEIFTTRGRFSLVARLDSENNHGFFLPLSGAPKKKDMQWTEWYPHAKPGAPPLPDGFQYRYRVQKRSEPVRTEALGPFEVQTIAWYFYIEQSREPGKTVLAMNGRFAIRYRGQPVVVDAQQTESNADTDKVEKADGVAVIGGPQHALLAHFVDSSSEGPCYLLVDDHGRLRTTHVPDCISVEGAILTSDTAAFRNGARKEPTGRIDRLAFATPGLYAVGGSVLDTRRLAVYAVKYPEDVTVYPSTPPLGIAPDERSFVRVGNIYNGDSRTVLAVADFVGTRSYLVPIDEARMRYASPDALDPAWLMHHFAWEKGSNGVDSLVERKGFVPIPYHTRYVSGSGYWLELGREPLRDAIIELLVTEFKGERVAVESYAYEYPVKIGSETVNVAYNDTGHYVSISLPNGATDTALLDTVARRVDAVLATGKYDGMFGK